MEQGLYPYLPSLFSIYLILISDVAAGYLKSLVDDLANSADLSAESEGPAKRQQRRDLIQNVAWDWSTRLGFINSMIAAIISALAVFANAPQYYDWAITTTLLFLIAIFTPMLYFVLSYRAGGLVVTKLKLFGKERKLFGRWEITPARLCDIILIGVNIMLMSAIFLSQLLDTDA
jgi:hypothetical protein